MSDTKATVKDGGRQPALPLTWDTAKTGETARPQAGAGQDSATAVIADSANPGQPSVREPLMAVSSTAVSSQETSPASATSLSTNIPGKVAETGTTAAPVEASKVVHTLSADENEKKVSPPLKPRIKPVLTVVPKMAVTEPKVVKLGKVDLSLGQMLLEARGAANLTVAQVSQKTRIPKNVIEALEGDNPEQFPAAVYAKSYISQLCREYNIEPDPLLAEYEKVEKKSEGAAVACGPVLTSQETETGPKVRININVQSRPQQRHGLFLNPTSLLVSGVILVVVLLVLSAVGVQKWRQNHAVRNTSVTVKAAPLSANVKVDDLIIPQQLPMEELPVPEK